MSKVTVNGIELAYEDVGTGHPVVLLHGYPLDRSMWSNQVAALKQTHRVITPDLRGHGESAIAAGAATMQQMASDVAGLLQALDISRATLGGLSMGGYVALAFYRLFQLRVRSLVLVDTRAQEDTEEAKTNRAIQAERALQQGMEFIAESMLPKLLTPESVTKKPELVRQVREMILRTTPQGAAAALQGMAQREDQTLYLSRIIAPTLIIVGQSDSLTPVEDAELMHRQIGGSRLEIIEGAAHLSNMEQPEEFNRVLTTFLHDLEG